MRRIELNDCNDCSLYEIARSWRTFEFRSIVQPERSGARRSQSSPSGNKKCSATEAEHFFVGPSGPHSFVILLIYNAIENRIVKMITIFTAKCLTVKTYKKAEISKLLVEYVV